MAKLFASEVAVRAAEECVQIHGGYGFIKDYPAEKFYRDVKLMTIGEGTSEIQRLVIAPSCSRDRDAHGPHRGGDAARSLARSRSSRMRGRRAPLSCSGSSPVPAGLPDRITGPREPARARSWTASRPSSARRAHGRDRRGGSDQPLHGGAILGDRVRMQAHAGDGGVFIRSMATRGHLGGSPARPARRRSSSTRRARTWSSSRRSAWARTRWTSCAPPTCRW